MEDYREQYLTQLQGVNSLVLNAIDAIIEDTNTEPLIIIVSDHGPASVWRTVRDGSGVSVRERYSNLCLIRPPSSYNVSFPEDLGLVNLFPVILNSFFGFDLEMLPDEYYHVDSRYPNKFVTIDESMFLQSSEIVMLYP